MVGKPLGHLGLRASYMVDRWTLPLWLHLAQFGRALGKVDGLALLETVRRWVLLVCRVRAASISWKRCLVLLAMLATLLSNLLVVLWRNARACLKWLISLASIWHGGSGVGSILLVLGICLY